MSSGSPRKRRYKAGVVTTVGAELDATQKAYSAAWHQTLVTSAGSGYASDAPPFVNGQKLVVATTPFTDDLLGGVGENTGSFGHGTGLKAHGMIAFDAAVAADTWIDITGASGVTKRFIAHASTETAGSRVWKSAPGGDAAGLLAMANSLKACIENAAGFGGEIDCYAPTGGDSGLLMLVNVEEGGAANWPITVGNDGEEASSANAIAGFKDYYLDGMSGGRVAIGYEAELIPHYWFDTTNSGDDIAAAVAKSITSATGVIYDPSGPNSKYISGYEKVSLGDKRYIHIRPTGWTGTDYDKTMHLELIVDTAPTDKVSLYYLEDDVSTTGNVYLMQNAVSQDGSALTDPSGDITLGGAENMITCNGSIIYRCITAGGGGGAPDRTGGFLLAWERDNAGVTDDVATATRDISNGFYLRWHFTDLSP